MTRPAAASSKKPPQEDLAAFTSTLQSEMDDLRAMVRQLLDRPAAAESSESAPDLPEELREYYTQLIQNEVAEEIAHELIAEARDRLREWRSGMAKTAPGSGESRTAAFRLETEQRQLRELIPEVLVENIERMLPPAEPVRLNQNGMPKCVALVGPTGVGKTTTIAKLAAHFKLRDNKRVGMITIDTYRIAAVDQLKAYADILSVPLEVVMTPEEMAPALRSMDSCDLVLIDTSGRSQRDTQRLDDLKVFLDAVREAEAASGTGQESGELRKVARGPDGRFLSKRAADDSGPTLEVHLVLSCTAHPAQQVEAAEKFGKLGVDRVVFTKLDEAVGLGVILNVIRRLDLQLSYLTTGQDVPDDIEVGHRRRIAELVLGRGEPKASLDARTLRAAPAVDHVA